MKSLSMAVLMVATVILGCSREDPSKPVAVAKSVETARPTEKESTPPARPQGVATPPAAAGIGAPASNPLNTPANVPASPAGTIVRKVSVQQEGTPKGIVARVVRIASDDKHYHFAVTDATGAAVPNLPCEATDQFNVEPMVPAYLQAEALPCAEVLVFQVPTARATYALVLLGDDAMKTNDFASAQAYYASAASRLRTTDAVESQLLVNRAHIALGKSLGFAQPTINVDGVEVLAPNVVRKLQAIQASKNLPVTGKVDSLTASAIAGIRQDELLSRAAAVPEARLEVFKIDSTVVKVPSPHANLRLGAKEKQYTLKAMGMLEKGK